MAPENMFAATVIWTFNRTRWAESLSSLFTQTTECESLEFSLETGAKTKAASV